MEKYRKTLKQRNLLFALLILCMLFPPWLNIVFNENETTALYGFVHGFTLGACSGIIALSVVFILKNIRLIKDEQKLQLAYNRENDERMKLIRAKAGMPMLLIMSILFIAAGLIISHFSIYIGITMVAMGSIQVVAGSIVKGVYSMIL